MPLQVIQSWAKAEHPILILVLLAVVTVPPLCLAILTAIRPTRMWLLAQGRKAFSPDTHNMAVSLRAEEEVRVELATLLKLTLASRAFLIRFHNGTAFYPSNPIWKLTCTSELVSSGVNYWRSEALHETHVSRWQELVAPVIDDVILRQHLDWTGVESSGPCSGRPCSEHCARTMVLFDVENMRDGYVKAQLQKHGVATMFCTALYSSTGQAVGIVGLDFFHAAADVRADMPAMRVHTCATTRKLQDILFTHRGSP